MPAELLFPDLAISRKLVSCCRRIFAHQASCRPKS